MSRASIRHCEPRTALFHRASAPPAASPGGTHVSPEDPSLSSWNKGASSTSRLLTLPRSLLLIPKRLQWSSWETGYLAILETEVMLSSAIGLLCPLGFKTQFQALQTCERYAECSCSFEGFRVAVSLVVGILQKWRRRTTSSSP